MPKLHIDARLLQDDDAEELRSLLVAADCDPDDVDLIRSIPEANDDADDEVIVCLLTPAMLSEARLESILLQAINGGRRVIGIWPKESGNLAAPPSVLKYCYSVVPWDADRLREVVRDDDCICFQTPEGEALEMPEPERRICP